VFADIDFAGPKSHTLAIKNNILAAQLIEQFDGSKSYLYKLAM
jgi:hypothetical protein